MVQIITKSRPPLSQTLGTALGQGISQGLGLEDPNLTAGERQADRQLKAKRELNNKKEFISSQKSYNQAKNYKSNLKQLHQINENPRFGGRYDRAALAVSQKVPFGQALLSAPAALWEKNLIEFSKGAKETFGSRVTNFDLETYMKGFPSIFHTKEARTHILKNLEIINELNVLHGKAVQDVVKEAGGLKNISWDEVLLKADELIEDQAEQLLEEYDRNAQFLSDKELKAQENRPSKQGEFIWGTFPDGSRKKVAPQNLEKAMAAGFEVEE